MKCFLEGDQLCVTKDDFVNLQESNDVVFISLTPMQIMRVKELMEIIKMAEDKKELEYKSCTLTGDELQKLSDDLGKDKSKDCNNV